ncbi:MAG: PEP-CTERM sorting domain-containing protein [Cyanobacteria bacterium J06627_28]
MFKKATLIAGVVATALLGAPQAMAGQVIDGWNYSIDAVGDSNDGPVYDIRAIAIKETTDTVYVSISANLPLSGVYNDRAEDSRIGWGDLFFDFSGEGFSAANEQRQLYAVKFSSGNNASVEETGVYGEVSAKSVGPENNGFRTLEEYFEAGLERPNTLGSDFTDKESAYQYYGIEDYGIEDYGIEDYGIEDYGIEDYGSEAEADVTGEKILNEDSVGTPIDNVIDQGTRLGDVRLLTEEEARAAGVNFDTMDAAGTAMITLAFDRDLLPTGSFVSSVFVECANDGVAIAGALEPEEPSRPSAGGGAVAALSPGAVTTEIVSIVTETEETVTSVPEPSGVLGLMLLGAFGALRGRRRK